MLPEVKSVRHEQLCEAIKTYAPRRRHGADGDAIGSDHMVMLNGSSHWIPIGSPAMVSAMHKMLSKVGVDDDNIRTEEFQVTDDCLRVSHENQD